METKMLDKLKREVRKANQKLVELGLVKLTFGNLSAIDELREYVAIKPSGVDYSIMKTKDMVILDLSGEKVQGDKNPSSDTPTHLELYRRFGAIGSVIHTHSEYATSFAQARVPIKCIGTTHADYFHGDIPVTRNLTEDEIKKDYELNTGKVIVETFAKNNLDPLEISACLVSGHGPFVWGKTIDQAVENALILEELAKMNFKSMLLNNELSGLDKFLLDKHYLRKHGKNAYYGQKTK
ncbi:L-fuculose phosphate aldolase [uncultured archaeon]|nr:L-fuculose phosphate aldolase [uncultured archaeon]